MLIIDFNNNFQQDKYTIYIYVYMWVHADYTCKSNASVGENFQIP